ncbi:hypothetical protein HK104_002718 [Borealophlyctis nickersoniae]|nr:hypothetical protein HK104_002718 [Borealophlyctis nickersoniae]
MLDQIPNEVLLHIAKRLDLVPFCRVTSTCRALHAQLHPNMPFLATTSNRWWFWSVNAKNVTSGVDTCWCRGLTSRAAEDPEWLDWSSDSESEDARKDGKRKPLAQRILEAEEELEDWGMYDDCCAESAESMAMELVMLEEIAEEKLDKREERNALRFWVVDEKKEDEDNPCLFAAVYSAEVQEKIDQTLSSSAPGAAATLFNNKEIMRHLCGIASSQKHGHAFVCDFHLLSRGILLEQDIWSAIGLDREREDEIIMQYMRGKPSEDGARLNVPVPLIVKGSDIAYPAVALQPLNEEVWGQEEEMERLARERGIRLEEDYDSDVQMEEDYDSDVQTEEDYDSDVQTEEDHDSDVQME